MGSTSIQDRAKGWLTAAWRFVRSAPLTYLWLTVLLITTIIQHQLGHRELHDVLIHGSTNLHELATDPLKVLFESLLWIDGRYWTPYLVLFTVFLAPAERWLGEIRWLAVGLTAHIGATYFNSRARLSHRNAVAMGLPRGLDHRLRGPADDRCELHCNRPLLVDLHRPAVLSDGPMTGQA